MSDLLHRLLWIAAYSVGLLWIAMVLHETLSSPRRWVLEQEQFRHPKLPKWKQVLDFALTYIPAFVIAVVLLGPGGDWMARRIAGEQFDPEEYAPGLVGLMLVVAVAAMYLPKVKELATKCADLEHEERVSKLMLPLANTWGESWSQELGKLRAQLAEKLPSRHVWEKEVDALEVAIARAEKESYRGESDLVVVRRSDVAPSAPAVESAAPQLRALIGKRIAGITASVDGNYVQIDFSDQSCLVMPGGARFTSGMLHANWAEALTAVAKMDKALIPDPSELRVMSYAQDGDAKKFNDELRRLLITLWSKATSDSSYVKDEWKQMDGMLSSLGMRGDIPSIYR